MVWYLLFYHTNMNIYLTILCGVFVFDLTSSSSVPPIMINSKSKDIEFHNENTTTLIIPSEGGAVLTNASITLPKESRANLLDLDTELVKNKPNSVVPRKGVNMNLYDSQEHIENVTDTGSVPDINRSNKTYILPNNTDILTKEVTNTSTEILNNTVHKPTVLSSKILDELGEKFDIKVDPKIKKLENSHPDLVMPIVITILVVPMFAVVSYMVVKRGQEAWKNRHYKRMDFLLDGMYND